MSNEELTRDELINVISSIDALQTKAMYRKMPEDIIDNLTLVENILYRTEKQLTEIIKGNNN